MILGGLYYTLISLFVLYYEILITNKDKFVIFQILLQWIIIFLLH